MDGGNNGDIDRFMAKAGAKIIAEHCDRFGTRIGRREGDFSGYSFIKLARGGGLRQMRPHGRDMTCRQAGARRVTERYQNVGHRDWRLTGLRADRNWRGLAIAGPTASGKSRLALDWASSHDGIIINADAMQVYSDLRVITARPGAADEAIVPHRLYGIVDGSQAGSAQIWAERACAEIAAARAQGAMPVLVGGTGLYFRALFEGLADLPDIPEAIRRKWRERATDEGSMALHAELRRRDPAMAARLRPSDAQRVTRALEVIDTTGRSLAAYHEAATTGLEDPAGWERVCLLPEREKLHGAIAARVRAMIAHGAVGEVEALLARKLHRALPVMKAIGVNELGAYLAGEGTLDEAQMRMMAATRRYAKRQVTWMRTQMADWRVLGSAAAM